MQLRQLRTIEEFRQVFALEQEIWGYTSAEDSVPVPIMVVSVKIGGLLIGAFDENERMVGFAYSLPGIKRGQPFQWSHMLGVVDEHRNTGLGWRIKLEQRRLVLEAGLDLIEWTYDPLQALNAHLNFVKLGTTVSEYRLNVYGESSSALHQGTPTDRFVAEWWLRSDQVTRRLEEVSRGQVRSGDCSGATPVNRARDGGEWLAPGSIDLSLDAPRLAVTIPTGFTEMQQRDRALAQAWRASTREIFTTYLPWGYSVVDFCLDRAGCRGTYLLDRQPAAGG